MQTRTSINKTTPTLTELPTPLPGKVLSIPISLWPEYLRLHKLEVTGKKDDVVLVRSSQIGGMQ